MKKKLAIFKSVGSIMKEHQFYSYLGTLPFLFHNLLGQQDCENDALKETSQQSGQNGSIKLDYQFG